MAYHCDSGNWRTDLDNDSMEMNNKGRRHELKMLKYKKRLRNYGIAAELGIYGTMYSFRSHGKPCSCIFCSEANIVHNGLKKKERKELLFQIEHSVMLGADGDYLLGYIKTAC